MQHQRSHKQNPTLRCVSPAAKLLIVYVLLGTITVACGVTVAKKTSNRGRLDATVTPEIVLSVDADIKDNARTNLPRHKIKTSLVLNNAPGMELADLGAKFVTKVSLTGPSGAALPVADGTHQILADGQQNQAAAEWGIDLADRQGSSEGTYVVTISAQPSANKNLDGIQLPKTWSAKVVLDSLQPVIGLASQIDRDVADGSRILSAYAWISNKASGSCTTGQLRTSDASKTVSLVFTSSNSVEQRKALNLPEKTPLFQAKGVGIPSDLTDPFTILARCVDDAGNVAEFIQPVGVSMPKLLVAANVVGNTGVPVATGGSARIPMVKAGDIEIKVGLVDANSSAAVSKEFLGSIQSLMQVVVTEQAPKDLDDLANIKPVIWSQPFASAFKMPLPSGYDGAKSLYLSLTTRDIAANKTVLIGTVPMPIFVVTQMPQISWASTAQFKPFAAGLPISGDVLVTLTQAPLAEGQPFALEYTSDMVIWQPLQAEFVTVGPSSDGKQTRYQFSSTYPLANEQAFRVRVKASDVAGNTVVSALSPSLIGNANMALDLTDAEKATCATTVANAVTPQSKFTPWLASSILCQRPNAAGQQTGPYYAQLMLQNRGGAAVQFYSTATIAPGMGYRVVADGVSVFQGRFIGDIVAGIAQPPSAFNLPAAGRQLFAFQIDQNWLTASKVLIEFDEESTGANSITNSCYAAGSYRTVVIQDKAAKLIPALGALPCDG